MRLAIPQWQGRVSPVLDVAGEFLLVDLENGSETGREVVSVDEDAASGRAGRLRGLGVEVVVCGAVSWLLELALREVGIELISQTRGEVDCVVDAYVSGRLDQSAYLMPGCRGRRLRFRGGR